MNGFAMAGSAGLVRRIRKSDKVVLSTIALFAALALAAPAQAVRSAGFIGDALFNILPFLLVSVFLAAMIMATGLSGQMDNRSYCLGCLNFLKSTGVDYVHFFKSKQLSTVII